MNYEPESQTKSQTILTQLNKYKILVVDDDHIMLNLIKRYYPNDLYELDCITTGNEALERIFSNEKYDMVLLDIMLPDINGYEVCKKIRENFVLYELPIIIITARSSINDVIESFKSGANDYISKPFEKNELILRTQTQVKLKRLITANHNLQQAINYKNKFIQMTIHDLRNPLTIILGVANLLKMENPKGSDYYEFANLIQDSAEHMLEMINELINTTKIESSSILLRKENVDLNQIASEVIRNNRNHALQKSQELIFTPCIDHHSVITSDRIRVMEIMDNLISNAIKYSPLGSRIWVNIKNHNHNGNQFLEFIVKDEGPGFTDEDKKKLFKQFQTLSAKPTGNESSTGLGLSIVKQLVDMLEANLILESEHGMGSKFIIQFKQ